MGPGFNARPEAHAFSAKYPHVYFPDQPLKLNFTQLVDWTCGLIKAQYEAHQKPLCILAHSFGAQLVAAAFPKVAPYINELRILNSPAESFSCFVNIASSLYPNSEYDHACWKDKSVGEKIGLILQVSQEKCCTDLYWNNKVAQGEYSQIAAAYPPLDPESFIMAYTEYLQQAKMQNRSTWEGQVLIYYSLEDNLLKDLHLLEGWRQQFPKASFIETPQLGHFSLFESQELAGKFFANS